MGADRWVEPTAEESDAFLSLFPPGSKPKGNDRRTAHALKDVLDLYNNTNCSE